MPGLMDVSEVETIITPTNGSRFLVIVADTSVVGGNSYRFTRPFRFNSSDLISRSIPAVYRRTPDQHSGTAVRLLRIMELTDELLSGDGVRSAVRRTFNVRFMLSDGHCYLFNRVPEAISRRTIVCPSLTRVSSKSISRAGQVRFRVAPQWQNVRRRQSRSSALLLRATVSATAEHATPDRANN